MPKARTVLSDSDLTAYSKERLQCKISMLIGCARLLSRPFQCDMPDVAMIFRNLVASLGADEQARVQFFVSHPDLELRTIFLIENIHDLRQSLP